MNISFFIARRLRQQEQKSFSATVSVVGVMSIAFSLFVMLISFSILKGFQQTIKEKIFSFGGHFQVKAYDVNNEYEENPVSVNTKLYKNYKKLLPEVQNIQVFAHKPGLLKTDDELLGVVFKGVADDFDVSHFKNYLTAGSFIHFPQDSAFSKEVVISQKIADKLRIKINDKVIIYFIQDPPRAKQLTVTGIYETSMEEFDENFIYGDIALLRNINDWADTLTGGYEIYLKDFDQMPIATEKLEEIRDFDMEVVSVSDRYATVFEWLELLDRNVIIFFWLILFVACFNMISILLILIMERTQMIGLLKTFGANDGQIRNIFIWKATNLILKGLLWGNIMGLGFCAVQYFFKIIPLDRHNYYMDAVPIAWDWLAFILFNLAVIVLVVAVLFLPVLIISRI
ncbi:MAG: ABC transporter permease, partial [Verrucomicrobia bacterium]|nr:ABC transporter permease [Cytophagales bacterium]